MNSTITPIVSGPMNDMVGVTTGIDIYMPECGRPSAAVSPIGGLVCKDEPVAPVMVDMIVRLVGCTCDCQGAHYCTGCNMHAF